MKIVSDNIKNALKQPTTQRKGKILVNGNYYEVYNVEYYADSYEDGNVIGNAIASQLDFDLPYMEKFNTFKYFDGVWTGNEYEYVDMGTFTVFDEQDEDEFNKHITSFDNLIKFNAPFEEVGTYPKTLYEELQNICQQAGVELVNATIPNGNFQIENNQFVNGETLKTVLKAICQISGNYAIIKEDKLILQLTNDTDEKIIKSQHEPTTWKRKSYGINQVILQLGDVEGEYVIREDKEDIAKNGVHKLVITNNPFAYTQDKRDTLIDNLFNQVRGFGYIPFEMSYEWLNYLEIGDKITIDDIETIVLRIQGKSPKSLESVMAAPATIDSSVEYVDNTDNIKNKISRVEIIVDKHNQMIQSIAKKVADVSNIVTGVGSITLENAHEGPLHKLTIKGNVNLIYPSNNLFPSSNLYPKSFKLQIDETIYDLDINCLNYINSNVCDEFVYENGNCYIIHRVGIDENGEMYELTNEVIEQRKNILINVLENSTITLIEFGNAILTAEYLLQNQYTDVFATEAYVNSEIRQTADEINLEVSKKVNEDEVVSTINQSSEQITLRANRLVVNSSGFTLDGEGNMIATSGNIAGFNINANEFKVNVRDKYIYTRDDTTRMNEIINGATPTDEEKEKFDINGNGIIDKDDVLLALRKINGYASSEGTFAIHTDNANEVISLEGNGNGYRGSIGMDKITIDQYFGRTAIIEENISCETMTQTSLKEKKKNFETLENAIEILKKVDIYKYNLIKENDINKKHIGFVIGNDFNYSEEITSEKNDGVDLYSMTSVLWQAVKEQQEEIEKLKEMINNGL